MGSAEVSNRTGLFLIFGYTVAPGGRRFFLILAASEAIVNLHFFSCAVYCASGQFLAHLEAVVYQDLFHPLCPARVGPSRSYARSLRSPRRGEEVFFNFGSF